MLDKYKLSDLVRVSKAFLTNLYAWQFPKSYMRYTNETGRGLGEESPSDVCSYFIKSFLEYFKYLDVTEENIPIFLKNMTLLEYGPGDIPGVALIFYAKGANKVYCADRFPLLSFSKFNLNIINQIISGLSSQEQERAKNSFNQYGNPKSGFREDCIQYIVNKKGLSFLNEKVDLIYSRAVLEHVNDLDATFKDMEQALLNNGIAIHKVDLKSHGLHQNNILDFLKWPNFLWNMMYSNKGAPNRHRLSDYRKAIQNTKLKIEVEDIVDECENNVVEEIRPYLAKEFQNISNKELTCLSFWIKLKK